LPSSTTSLPAEAISPPLHLRLRDGLDNATEKLALRAALTASHLLGLAMGQVLRDLRGRNDPLAEATARFKEAELRATLAWDIVEILGARLDKIPDRQRPYYTPPALPDPRDQEPPGLEPGDHRSPLPGLREHDLELGPARPTRFPGR
jgi:hypothetical protein